MKQEFLLLLILGIGSIYARGLLDPSNMVPLIVDSFCPSIVFTIGAYGYLAAATLSAIIFGFWLDGLSSNPIGVNILALIVIGLAGSLVSQFFNVRNLWGMGVLGAIVYMGYTVIVLIMISLAGYINELLLGWTFIPVLAVWMLESGIITMCISALLKCRLQN